MCSYAMISKYKQVWDWLALTMVPSAALCAAVLQSYIYIEDSGEGKALNSYVLSNA
jgi:hypothetical protein